MLSWRFIRLVSTGYFVGLQKGSQKKASKQYEQNDFCFNLFDLFYKPGYLSKTLSEFRRFIEDNSIFLFLESFEHNSKTSCYYI